MRPHALSEIEVAGYLARGDVDGHHVGAIGAGLAHARVAVDGHVCRPAIGRCDQFMAGHAAFGDRGHLLPGFRVDDPQSALAFVGDNQETFG